MRCETSPCLSDECRLTDPPPSPPPPPPYHLLQLNLFAGKCYFLTEDYPAAEKAYRLAIREGGAGGYQVRPMGVFLTAAAAISSLHPLPTHLASYSVSFSLSSIRQGLRELFSKTGNDAGLVEALEVIHSPSPHYNPISLIQPPRPHKLKPILKAFCLLSHSLHHST
jgi:hypothetical protein